MNKVSGFSAVASCTPTSIAKIDNSIPEKFYLSQNYPNPFNPLTTIRFGLKKQTDFSIKIYDALGRQIKTLLNSNQPAGNYEIVFNAQEFSSGIYFYKFESTEFTTVKKMLLIK